jgi:hypothetical protein
MLLPSVTSMRRIRLVIAVSTLAGGCMLDFDGYRFMDEDAGPAGPGMDSDASARDACPSSNCDALDGASDARVPHDAEPDGAEAGDSDVVHPDADPGYCGNGRLDEDETCDEAEENGTGPGRCSETCRDVQACGDGTRQGTEACDDGSHNGRPTRCDLGCAFECNGNCPVYVDMNGPAEGDGRTWESAFPSIQQGVDAAVENSGGEVWVARGTYTTDAAEIPVVVIPEPPAGRIEIYGGFAGFELTRDERDPATFVAVLDGAGLAHHVVRGYGDYLLEGFVIVGGNANAIDTSEQARGGGMYNQDGAPAIRNCTFRENFASHSGGAMHNEHAFPQIERCAFESNRAGTYDQTTPAGGGGGAISARVANGRVIPIPRISITDTAFSTNFADGTGGAIWMAGCIFGTVCDHLLELRRVTFAEERTGFSTGQGGGVIALADSHLIAEDVTMVGGAGVGSGGCLRIGGLSTAELTAVRLECGADGYGGAVYNQGSLMLTDSQVQGSRAVLGANAIFNTASAIARIHNTVFGEGGRIAVPVIGNEGTLEVVHSTFWETCPCDGISDPTTCCFGAISGSGATTVAASVFWPERAPDYATSSCASNAASLAGAGNVALAASPFDGDSPRLLPASPCRNAGSDALAESIGLDFANLSTQLDGCRDSSPVDLGAHFATALDAPACP